MAVLVLEARDCTSPVFLVRTWALLCGCLSFSLVASLEPGQLREPRGGGRHRRHHDTFWVTCMFTWCFFFTLTLLIHVLNVIQFHSLLPVSWKNLTVTVAALGALMTLSAAVLLPWRVLHLQLHLHQRPAAASARPLAAAVAACLTALAYCSEVCVIRGQSREQRGYMASLPGVLKIFQCWGGCQMIPLFLETMAAAQAGDDVAGGGGIAVAGGGGGGHAWKLWVSVGLYNVCLLMSVASVAVILCDCAGRFCPFPFSRLLAGFSLLGVLCYMVAAVICVTNVLHADVGDDAAAGRSGLLVMEAVVVSVTLMAYTVDFSFSIKQLCERGHV